MSEEAQLPSDADVVVIGGGLSGTSIGCQLARAGARVVLLEKGTLACGASGASFGWISVHFASYMPEYPDYHMRLMRRALDAFADTARELGPEIEYDASGGMSLVYTHEQWERQATLAQRLTASGIEAQVVPREDVLKREPALAGPFIGALVSPMEGLVNPFRLVGAWAREAARHGAVILTRMPATGIQVRGGAVAAVTTPRGVVRTPAVVNAAGVDAPAIGRLVGRELPVHPNRGQQLVVEGPPGLLTTAVYGHVPVRSTRAGNYIVGGLREQAGFQNVVTPEGLAFVAREAAAMIPGLCGHPVSRGFSGLRPVPADGKPIYGPVPGVRGYFVANLHFGLTLAPLTGRILAACVLGREPEVDLAPYLPDRFCSGKS
jgi:sarcosine oxidase subunit beta